jgi:HlyD family secretion protein
MRAVDRRPARPGPFLTLILAGLLVLGCGDRGSRVEVEEISRRDLVEAVRASGRVRPKQKVDVSASVMGRIDDLRVAEGDPVAVGDVLLRIDPVAAEGRLAQARAQLASAEASLATAEARLDETADQLHRQESLFGDGLVSESQVITARANHNVQLRTVEQLRAGVRSAEASVAVQAHEADQVTIHSPIEGVVIRRNVEEGENVVTGTMNNPGTVLMTIANLGVMECEVLVDETEVVHLRLGQAASVEVDAFPDTTFEALVTEVGNSAARAVDLGSQTAIDYKVVVELTESRPGLRPDLSATAEIVVATRDDVVAVPIQSVTRRRVEERDDEGHQDGDDEAGADREDDERDDGGDADDTDQRVDGVFVVDGNRVRFRPVSLGITGERHFEVTGGLEPGESVVLGPFDTLRTLQDGDKVRVRRRPRGDPDQG